MDYNRTTPIHCLFYDKKLYSMHEKTTSAGSTVELRHKQELVVKIANHHIH